MWPRAASRDLASGAAGGDREVLAIVVPVIIQLSLEAEERGGGEEGGRFWGRSIKHGHLPILRCITIAALTLTVCR